MRGNLRACQRVVRILVALAVVIGSLSWAPQSADAALTGANPADGTGELYPDFTTDDALFAYVQSDTRGGRVCVIAATGNGDCDRPAWGSPNTVLGIGTVFTLLEGPDLKVGTWRLHTENPLPGDEWASGYTSDVFTVRPCEIDCDKQIGRQQADAFKAASGANTRLATTACTALQLKERAADAADAAGKARAVGRAAASRVARGPAIIASPVGGGLAFGPAVDFPSYNDAALQILMMLSCQVARMHNDIADDPPDPTLYEVAAPELVDPDPTGNILADALADSLDRQAAHGIAARISYERYQGAVLAGDLAAQRIQSAAAGTQAQALAQELRASAAGLRDLAEAAPSDPTFDGVAVSAAARSAFVSISSRIRSTGLTADERQQLVDLGLAAEEIDAVQGWLLQPFEDVPADTPLVGILQEVADGFDASVAAVDAFARNAAAISTTDLAPPTAGVEETYVDAGTRRFTATGTSSDGDPVVHEWDFGDGTTATGAVVEHDFTANGQYLVRVTTRETTPWGSATTSTYGPVTVILDGEPAAREDVLTVAAGGSASIDVLANDSDPEGGTLEVVDIDPAQGGTVTCEPTGLCTYTATPGIVGTETLGYRITDGTSTVAGILKVEIVAATTLVAGDVSVTIPRGSGVIVPLPVSDPDPGPLAALQPEVVDAPAVVSVTPHHPESVRIDVPHDATPGTDTFTYRVTDGAQWSAPARVTVTITAENQAPTAADMSVATPAGVRLPITLQGSDPDGTPLQYVLTAAPTAGSISGTFPQIVYDPGTAPPGTYTFGYQVNDGLATSAPATVTVTVGPPPGGPIVDLGDDIIVNEGHIFFSAFARDPDGGTITYEWDFGDGRTSDQPAPSLLFDDGIYVITLTVRDSSGRTDSDSLTMTVRNLPPYIGGIGTSNPPYGVGDPVSLSVSSVDPGGDPLEYHWDFGDGTTLTTGDAFVVHTYDTPGVRTVRVRVVDDDGAFSTATRRLEIIELAADAGPDQVVPEGSYVTFTGSGFLPPDVALYDWDFGDGTDLVYGGTVSHRWTGDEPRSVSLRIRSGPQSATDTADVTFTNLPPTLGPAVPLVVEVGQRVDLLAGAFDPGDDPVTVDWDLGDETVATGHRVAKAYTAPGDYVLTITAEDDEGASTTAVAGITVVPVGTLDAPTIDSRGRRFHFAFDGNQDRTQAEQYLLISGEQDTTGTVSVPGLGFRADFSIAAGRVSTVRLPDDVVPDLSTWGSRPFPPPTVGLNAVVVHAREEVTVYGVNRQPFTTDAFLALPDDIAGTEYRAMSWGYSGSQLDVVATEADTTVTVTDGFTTVTETVQPGEVLRLNDNFTGAPFPSIAGVRVTADRPIQVLGGHFCTDVVFSFCDHLVEQVWPVEMMGRRFLTVPLATRAADMFRIVASRDATEVRVDGVLVATLEAGRFHDLDLSQPVEIVTSEPALVAQLSKGSWADNTDSDPFMVLLAPEEQWLDRYAVASLAGISRNYLNLVVRDGGQSGVRVDGVVVDPDLWTPIGTSDFVGAQVPVGAGEHRIVSQRPVSVTVYGFDVFDSYGYPGGLALAPVGAVAAIDLSPATATRQVGTLDCPVATVTDADGGPLAGVRVDLTVSGANPTEQLAFTGADGTVELCISGVSAGTDDLVVRNGITSAEATRTWETRPPDGPPDNRPPVVADVTATTDEDVAVEISLSGSDPDGDPVTFEVVTPPSDGTLGPIVGGRVTYTPNPGFSGEDSFTYAASDGRVTSTAATATITVVDVYDPPPPPDDDPPPPPYGGDPGPGPGPDPAPPSRCADVPRTGFLDVPADNVHRRAIDCLLALAITRGLSSELYGPDEFVTRGQLASFLARWLTTNGVALPLDPPNAFSDDDRSPHARAVDQLAALGLVHGTEGRFDPRAAITREQAASMLVRAVELVRGARLPPGPDAFADVGAVHRDAVNAAAAAGIIEGIDGARFDPRGRLRRDQMASILIRALELHTRS